MLKEIFDQPEAICQILDNRIIRGRINASIFGRHAAEIFPYIKQIEIVAGGSSYHASMVAKYWLETIAQLPCHINRSLVLPEQALPVAEGTLLLIIAQAHETNEALAILRASHQCPYYASLVFSNEEDVHIQAAADLVFNMQILEDNTTIAIKAFTAQLASLALLTLVLTNYNTETNTREVATVLHGLPLALERTLRQAEKIKTVATQLAAKPHAIVVGNAEHYAIALEGSLKLTQLSAIQTHAYRSKALTTKLLSLIDDNTPTIMLIPADDFVEEMKINICAAQAQDKLLCIFADASIDIPFHEKTIVISMPEVDKFIAPIVYILPLQLLAYYLNRVNHQLSELAIPVPAEALVTIS